jgi:outer membrane protein assembly factor BamA
VLAYDTRNDNYYPTKGIEFQTRWADYTGEAIGNLSYAKYSSSANFYIAATDEITVALRANFQGSYGDVPFYDLPNLDIRGYNRARFSDKFTLSLHAEARYMFSARWGVVGFIDGGWANDSVDGLLRGQAGSSFGSGLRWKVLESKSLHLGLDAAVSKDDAVVFIQIGEKF